MNDAFGYIINKQFQKAIDILTNELKKGEKTYLYNNRATAFLNLNKINEAKADYQRILEMAQNIGDGEKIHLAIIEMVLGNKIGAIDILTTVVKDCDNGKIQSSIDALPCATAAMLLFCFAKEINDEVNFKIAKDYLLYLSRYKTNSWPIPLIQFLLEKINEDSLVNSIKISKAHNMINRYYCKAFYYIAMSKNTVDDKMALFKKSIKYGQVNLLEPEYYLAKNELIK